MATCAEIAAQGWSLNPGRYVGVAEREADDGDWRGQLEALNEALEALNVEARELQERIGRERSSTGWRTAVSNPTSNREIVSLESICDLITDGKHGDCQNEEGSGYFFLSAKDVKDGKLQYDGAQR